jgi:hypothetical protein
VASDIQYVRSGGVAIAYKVVGEGEADLVYVPDYVSNLVYDWEYPLWRDFYERLAQSFRLILFDKRGTGLSDHGGQFASLETRMEDLHAVLDAVGRFEPRCSCGPRGMWNGDALRGYLSRPDPNTRSLPPRVAGAILR